MEPDFDELIAEAESEPIDGWDFAWLDGRATEDRPPWHYSELVAERPALHRSGRRHPSAHGTVEADPPQHHKADAARHSQAYIDAKIEHRADKHIAAEAAENIQVKRFHFQRALIWLAA